MLKNGSDKSIGGKLLKVLEIPLFVGGGVNMLQFVTGR